MERKERKVSLSLKLNLLITAIVLVVSVLLISIAYDAYTKTAFVQIHDRLDGVHTEQLEEDETLPVRCAVLYDQTHMDGFEESRRASAAAGDAEQLDLWLRGFWISTMTGDRMTKEEQGAYLEELTARAIEDGYSEESATEWILFNEPEFFTYIDGEYYYYSVISDVVSAVDRDEISRVRAYAEDGEGIVRLFDVSIPYAQTGSARELLMYGERTERAAAVEAYKKAPDQPYVSFRSEDGPEVGRVFTFEAPGENGENIRFYVVYSCDAAAVEKGRRDFLLRNILLVAAMVAAALAVSLLLLRRIATRPLKLLTEGVSRFGVREDDGESAEVIDLDIRSRDEIGELSRSFHAMQTRILENMDEITRMAAEKERISTELDLAARIQKDMLPNVFPPFPDRKEFDLYATMEPAKDVGGDFYDFFLIDSDHLAIVMADVSGKGVPAALFMMASRITLRNIAKTVISPAQILERLNEELLENNREDMFVTCWLGVLEISTGRLKASNAGHEYPVLSSADGVFALADDRPHGFAVGGMPDEQYREYEWALKPGQKLFLYTDGVAEAMNPVREQFGTDRLLEVLNRNAQSSLEDLLRAVRKEVDRFADTAEQFDDLTMLCLAYLGNGGE